MINRNAPCSCGSGKRYKHCCGQDGVPTASPKPATRSEALAAHRAGSLRLAESLYRRALEENPRDVDVLHMLGVVQLERLRYCEALDLILEAAERTDWKLPQVRHNLGLVLAKLLVRGDDARKSLVDAFLAWEHSQSRSLTGGDPLVSIVLPAYNHARYVGEALALAAGVGVTLAIIRKGRMLFWNVIGIVLLIRRGLSIQHIHDWLDAPETGEPANT